MTQNQILKQFFDLLRSYFQGPQSFHSHRRQSSSSSVSRDNNAAEVKVEKSAEETNYELLLEQQQTFLQMQLELSHKVRKSDERDLEF